MSTAGEFFASIPTPPIPLMFALAWLWAVLTVEGIKQAKTAATKAALGLMVHCALWAVGLLYIQQIKMF